MKSTLMEIIPRSFRRRSVLVAGTIFLRALLNFAGLAVLVPILVLILDPEGIHANPWFERLYRAGGFASDRAFALSLCGGIVLFILVKNLLHLYLLRFERKFTYDLYRTMSRRLYIEYHDRGLGFIKNSNSALLSRNINYVCQTFVSGILMPLAVLVSETLLLVLLFVSLLVYSPAVAGPALMIFIPSAWLYYGLVRKRLHRYGIRENEIQRDKARTVAETFRGYADLEICNAFPAMLRRFDRAMDEIVSIRSKNTTYTALPSAFMETGLSIGMALFVGIGFLTPGNDLRVLFGIFAVGALRLMPSVRNILSSWSALKYHRYTINILREVNFDRPAIVSSSQEPPLPFAREIVVSDLSFRFDDDRGHQEILHNLSFSIRKGERIGIRGASGKGKTTLFNLLLGFYTPTKGRITIDDTPLTAATRRRWQNTAGYVSQQVFLSDGTLLENIAPGIEEPDIDRRRAKEALKAVRLDDFVASLSRGMDTPIGESGCKLSGGQRQRIGIARALYKQAEILFFDEATSSLDDRTEESINRSIAELSNRHRDLTIVAIAHRESSLEYCDRIIDLDQYE